VRSFLVLAIAGWTLFTADGAQEGREGNERYRAGAYPAAIRAYQRGLAERDRHAASALTSKLWNNLGLALHRTDSTERAVAVFQHAFRTAEAAAGRGRAAYNAGTAAAQTDRDQAALGRLRQALLADSSHEAARFNFELVKRRLERKKKQQKKKKQKQKPSPDVQPSAFARRLKARADSLVARRRYADAYRLMTKGLRRDSTVRAFRSFIRRTSAVVQIDSAGTAAGP
jgi:tetratricopeptide (TPR) repeat protein